MHTTKRGRRVAVGVAVLVLAGPFAHAALFDFATADRTFLSGPLSTAPDAGDFDPVSGFSTELFLVGNLTNGCGLFPTGPVRSATGTGCTVATPTTGTLSNTINYDSGLDTFTLANDTLASLQMIVKLGHPEPLNFARSGNQNQNERFDIFLKGPSGSVALAQLLDDVLPPQEDDGYYLYVFDPVPIPAGTWYTSFVSVSGSVEFFTRLSAADAAVPEPATATVLAAGLVALGWARRRRSA